MNREKLDELIAALMAEAKEQGVLLRVVGGRPDWGTEFEETTPGYWQHSWC